MRLTIGKAKKIGERLEMEDQLEQEVAGGNSREKKIKDLESEVSLLRRKLWQLNSAPSKRASQVLLVAGLTSLVISYFFSSTIMTFIGLGLTFWGALLIYVTRKVFIANDTANIILASTLRSTEFLLSKQNFRGRAIYLPPRGLEELTSAKALVSHEDAKSLEIAQLNAVSDDASQKATLSPLGLDLAVAFEREFGTSFARVDFADLQLKLPDILTKAFDLFEDVQLERDGSEITVMMKGEIGSQICSVVRSMGSIHEVVGCPICSSLAVILANVFRRPIILEESTLSKNNSSLRNAYTLLGE